MAKATYTDQQKTDALVTYREHGACEAGRQTGIPQKTISGWAKQSGIQSDAPQKTRAATEMAALRMARLREEAKGKLAERVVDLLDRMDEEHVEFVGKDGRRERVDRASAEAVRHYSISVGVLIDKLRLEMGEATDRTEHVSQSEFDREVAELSEKVRRNASDDGRARVG